MKDKLNIAEKLEKIGIKQIQGGYPGRSKIDYEFIKTFKKQSNIKVEAIAQIFQKDWKKQIDMSLESGPDIIDLIYPSSELRLKYVQKVSKEQMMERVVEAIEYANKGDAVVRYAPVDTTRTEMSFLIELLKRAVSAGAQRITIADTAGAIIPAGMKFMVKEVKSHFDLPLQIHCHNDFGLALANSLAALEAGADIIDVTINGLGERAGNLSLDELVISTLVLYDLDLGIDTKGLFELSKYIETLTKVPLPDTKPIVGKWAFTHKLDAHVWGVLTYPPLYEVVPPELVGNKRIIPIGKYSGPVAIKAKLDQLGYKADDDEIKAIIEKVEAKAYDRHASLTDEEFLQIVKEVKGTI
ncbi:MAG: homoaconitate hydratase [Deltaproteobacteria bacterium]|nr:MAG: homoaconitate hydratase [Deltaproteobacteria bacterium]